MQFKFAIIGSGWRADFFLRCARQLPELFEVCGLVTRSAERQAAYQQRFSVKTYGTVDQLLMEQQPDFAVVSVAGAAIPEVSLAVLRKGIPVLAETRPYTLAELNDFYRELPAEAKFQIAEQYFMQPCHGAALRYLATGRLGEIVQAKISFTQTYHAMSLMRKYLGVGFENCKISGRKLSVAGSPGFSRTGLPEREEQKSEDQVLACFEFDGGHSGVYDFENNQHRSFIRSCNIVVKGVKGQIENQQIKYLKDYRTPMESEFIRKNKGELINMEGIGLKGILADGDWYYENPFPGACLSDDEIAVAECLYRMGQYAHGGESFYSFAEAAQDAYLGYMMEQAVERGELIQTETQIWAK